MTNVMDIEINPDIILDEREIKGMPYDLQQHVLITMTIGMNKYKCDWRELVWRVRFHPSNPGQPIISVKRKEQQDEQKCIDRRAGTWYQRGWEYLKKGFSKRYLASLFQHS